MINKVLRSDEIFKLIRDTGDQNWVQVFFMLSLL